MSIAGVLDLGLVGRDDQVEAVLRADPGELEADSARCAGHDGERTCLRGHEALSFRARASRCESERRPRSRVRPPRALRRSEPRRRAPRPRSRSGWRRQEPFSPSPFFRGTTCTWRCGTLWLTRLFIATNVPSAASAASTARATRWTLAKSGATRFRREVPERRRRDRAARRARGRGTRDARSRKATTRSSSSTRCAGASPRVIAQKGQGFMRGARRRRGFGRRASALV